MKITLATLQEASAQEVFDQVATHLLEQKKKATDGTDMCSYQSDGGLKCAAGCLIADEEYLEEFEGLHWHGLVDTARVPTTHKLLIGDLQYLHDHTEPETWQAGLEKLAKLHTLSMVAVN
jgi:hypothetical protein